MNHPTEPNGPGPTMRIAVTSQNFRTVTGHAGKTRRYLIYELRDDGAVVESGRLDLPKEMSLHEFRGGQHPLFEVDAVITAGCGEGYVRRLGTHGVRVVATSETDPQRAASALAAGRTLPAPQPHEH